MATIANLVAKLTGNTLQFQSSFEKAGKAISDIDKRINMLKSPLVNLKSLLATVGIIGFGMYASNVVTAQLELLRFTRQIDDSVENIELLKAALRSIGNDTNVAQNALATLSQMLAQANTGNLFAADVFKRLGLDIKQLNNIKPSEAFILIAQRLSQIKDDGTRAAFAVQLFGNDAGALLPILANANQMLGDAANKLQMFGGAANNVQLNKLEVAAIKFEELKAGVERAAVSIATEMAPAILAVLGDTENFVRMLNIGVDMFKLVGKTVLYIYAIVNNTYQGVYLLIQAMYVGLLGISKLWGIILNNIEAGFERVKGILLYIYEFAKNPLKFNFKQVQEHNKEIWDNMNDKQKKLMEDLQGRIDDQRRAFLDRAANNVMDFENIGNAFDNIGNKANALANKQDKLAKAGNAVANAFKNQHLYAQRFQAVFNENITPLEKFNSTMQELDTLLNNGLSWDVYGRAVAKAVNELEKAHSLGNISLPAAFSANSSEAISAINKAKAENNMANREKPQDRLERIQQNALAVETQTRDYTREIADAAKNRKIFVIPR